MFTDPLKNILEIDHLSVSYCTDDTEVKAVRDVSFCIPQGRTVAVLGESGCGKTVTALSLLGLIDPPGQITGGKAIFYDPRDACSQGIDLLEPQQQNHRKMGIRGNRIAMIFQEPVSSLTPVYSVGEHIIETLMLHLEIDRKTARQMAVRLLEEVGIPSPHLRVDSYPHQLSGGMCQRAMIAMAICCHPALLIADEPTTALDVTIQAQVLDLLKKLQVEHGTSILMITHDLGVASMIADYVVVMYLGNVVEKGSLFEVLEDPKHPYTQGLIRSQPSPTIQRSEPLAVIPGSIPDAGTELDGCLFRNRCCEEMLICRQNPHLQTLSGGHAVSCWLYDQNPMTTGDGRIEKQLVDHV